MIFFVVLCLNDHNLSRRCSAQTSSTYVFLHPSRIRENHSLAEWSSRHFMSNKFSSGRLVAYWQSQMLSQHLMFYCIWRGYILLLYATSQMWVDLLLIYLDWYAAIHATTTTADIYPKQLIRCFFLSSNISAQHCHIQNENLYCENATRCTYVLTVSMLIHWHWHIYLLHFDLIDIHEFGTNWMNVIILPTWFEWTTQYSFILITYKLVEYVWGRPNVSYVDYWLGHTAAISNISHSPRLFTLLCLLLNIHAILVYALFVHAHSAQLMQRSSKAMS